MVGSADKVVLPAAHMTQLLPQLYMTQRRQVAPVEEVELERVLVQGAKLERAWVLESGLERADQVSILLGAPQVAVAKLVK